MKKILYVLMAIGLVFTGCKKGEKTADASTESTPVQSKESTPVIVFEKTPCYGTCPNYTASIYKSGLVVFEGKRFVDLIGEYKFNLGEDWVKLTINKSKDINFFEMEDRYDGNVTDLPSTYTTINWKGESKKIKARYEIPQGLKDFNLFIHNSIMKQVEANGDKMKRYKEQQNVKMNQREKKPLPVYQPR